MNRGIADDRSKESETAFFAVNNNRLFIAPRKLRVGDVVAVVTDLTEGANSITISVNENEFSYTFVDPAGVPPWGNPANFWYGATFGTLRIIIITLII